MKSRFYFAALCLFLTSCSDGFGTRAESNAVMLFHKDFNRDDIAAILSLTTDAFKKSDARANIAAYFNGVYKKLGKNLDAKLVTWQVYNGISGKLVRLGYRSRFEKGSATEEFVFKEENGKTLIQHYNIQSRVFITGS